MENCEELKFGAWIHYDPEWLSVEESTELMNWLQENLQWEERVIFAFGKAITQPRLMSWCGELSYQYSGQVLPPRPIPDSLLALNNTLSSLCETPFNHIVLNRYRGGSDHMSLHADNEPELGRNPVIAALSLGCERLFQIMPKNKKGRYKHARKLTLQDGSLLVMGGRMQHTWRHSVPKSKVDGERINITFRFLRGEPGWREPKFWLQSKGLE